MSKSVGKVFKPISSVLGLEQKAPKVPKPVVQPLPDDEAIRKEKQRSQLEQTARSGRASTVLTSGGSETLG